MSKLFSVLEIDVFKEKVGFSYRFEILTQDSKIIGEFKTNILENLGMSNPPELRNWTGCTAKTAHYLKGK